MLIAVDEIPSFALLVESEPISGSQLWFSKIHNIATEIRLDTLPQMTP